MSARIPTSDRPGTTPVAVRDRRGRRKRPLFTAQQIDLIHSAHAPARSKNRANSKEQTMNQRSPYESGTNREQLSWLRSTRKSRDSDSLTNSAGPKFYKHYKSRPVLKITNESPRFKNPESLTKPAGSEKLERLPGSKIGNRGGTRNLVNSVNNWGIIGILPLNYQ